MLSMIKNSELGKYEFARGFWDIFGVYTCTFVMHMVYDILVVDTIVYDMQVWCGCVLFEVPLKLMTSRIVFAIVCMDMDFILMQWNV